MEKNNITKRITAKAAREAAENPVKLLNNFYKMIRDAAENGETKSFMFIYTIPGKGLAMIVDDLTDAGFSVSFRDPYKNVVKESEYREAYRDDLLDCCENIETVREIELNIEW